MDRMVKVGKEYHRSGEVHDVVEVVDMYIKNGKAVIVYIFVYDDYPMGMFYAGVEGTKTWKQV